MGSTSRVFRASDTAKSAILLEEDGVNIIGDKRHFINCDSRGTTIRGPVSFISDSSDRRTSGLFIGMNDFMQMIPSTMVTPIPHRIPYPPLFAIANIAKDLAFFLAGLS